MSNTRRAVTAVRSYFDRSPWLRIVAFAVSWRLLSAVLGFFANIVFPLAQRQFTVGDRPHPFWDAFARYDSGWYFGIARYGYEFVEGGRSNLAFMPVYPLSMRYVALALGGGRENVYLAGIIVSWVSFVLAALVLYRLARLFLPRAGAERAVVYASVFPFAFFYGVVYSEALYLLLTVTAFYGFATKRWWVGGLAGALAGATRVNGVLILPALAVLAWTTADRTLHARWRAAIGLAMVPAGLGAYSVFTYTLSGSFLEWMHSIQRWNYVPGGLPWSSLARVVSAIATRPYAYLSTDPTALFDTLNGAAALCFVLAVPFVWRRLGAAYGLFMLANLWLPLSSGSLEGLGRYCAVLFPCFIWLGFVRSRTVQFWVVASCASLYMLCFALFTKAYPIF
jgi:hypothetical protein